MKNITLFILLLLSAFGLAQEVVFEDENFKQMLLRERCVNKYSQGNENTSTTIDTNNNGKIEQNEIDDVIAIHYTVAPISHEFILHAGQTSSSSYFTNAYLTFPSFDSKRIYTQTEIQNLVDIGEIKIQKPLGYSIKTLNDLNKFKNVTDIILAGGENFNGNISSQKIENLLKIENFELYGDGVLQAAQTTLSLYNSTSKKYIEYSISTKKNNLGVLSIANLHLTNNIALTRVKLEGLDTTNLDISNLTALTFLECYKNKLSNLDISKNINLTNLDCSNNQLTNLDIYNNKVLKNLDCSNNNLNSLYLKNGGDIVSLFFNENPNVSYICGNDIDLTQIKTITDTYKIYPTIDSNCIIDTEVFIDSNFLKKLKEASPTNKIAKDLNGNYFKIDANGNGKIELTEVDKVSYLNVNLSNIINLEGINSFYNLKELDCSNNKITNLDISNIRYLTQLNCSNNELTSLRVNYNYELTTLDCSVNKLTNLILTDRGIIKYLYCSNNQLVNINISENTKLNTLDCSENKLTNLDTSKNRDLIILKCFNNQITFLDLSKNGALTTLNCSSNNINSLDISNNTNLMHLNCNFNKLTKLILKNGQFFQELKFSNNSNLNYICCDEKNLNLVKSLAISYGINIEIITNCFVDPIVYIDDYSFKIYLLDPNDNYVVAKDLNGNYFKIDSNNDKEIQVSEAEQVSSLEVNLSSSTSSLRGIEAFKNLRHLSCKTDVSNLDLSKNTSLTSLNIELNYRLISLDLSKNIALTHLNCLYNDKLTSLDLSKNHALINLNCNGNKNLTSLEVSDNINLTYLECNRNKLGSLNVSKNINLTKLDCSSNQLTTLDVSKNINLTKLDCYYNQLTSLDIASNTTLEELGCSNNQLSSLDVSKNTFLTKLNCGNNQLINLNVSKNINLAELFCFYNQLTSLDVSKNTFLTKLNCGNNQLTNLDVSKNINLTILGCSNNQLTNLDVSKNINLTKLDCSNNQLTSLDIARNTTLGELDCKFNQITSLNASHNPLLNFWNCDHNQLTSLYIKNGKIDYIYRFSFSSNPNLKYICCDEEEFNNVLSLTYDYYINPEINTYCSFAPNGNKNTITGKISLDLDNNGCDANDVLVKNLKIKLNDGTTTGYSITNDTANYTFYTQTGNFTLTPIFENPYYTVSPATVSFADANNNTKTQNFCIKPIANKNDLEVKIIPFDRARPGFNSKYELIYKNKGTTTLSGNVNFVFNKNYSVFQSSSVVPNSNSNGTILYSFSNLKPFEEKIITIELKHNTPTAPTFPLNGGEILNFSSIINPTTNDETLNDNTFALKQDVVNAYDPNDKTCLQGNSITPEMIGEFVDYQIRFENNGSAEATFIVVKDIIDTNLFDVETLSPTSSSHPYHLTIKNGNVVEFYFEDINLPFAPKEAKDPKAQGFISFKIKTKSTLKLGDVLKNKADIYFDYNKPILTNEEQTKIENLSSEEIINNSKFKINFTPNPAKDFIKFDNEVKSVQVFDLNGKLVQSSIVNGTEMNVSKYFLQRKNGTKK
jgi:uncharacterized repeat protein (TIGR01451 family)